MSLVATCTYAGYWAPPDRDVDIDPHLNLSTGLRKLSKAMKEVWPSQLLDAEHVLILLELRSLYQGHRVGFFGCGGIAGAVMRLCGYWAVPMTERNTLLLEH